MSDMNIINEVFEMGKIREKLPAQYENRYKSEDLKTKIADLCIWTAIPAVTGPMNSAFGKRRIKENDLLFSFIDDNFPEDTYDFEPNMMDGRYVFLPKSVSHQGIGICVSRDLPGLLEVGHFWYPCEFTEKNLSGYDQIYVPMFSALPDRELIDFINKVYIDRKEGYGYRRYCTFPFYTDAVVTLEGYFLDRIDDSVKTIRKELSNKNAQIQRNGEGLIYFMKRLEQKIQ